MAEDDPSPPPETEGEPTEDVDEPGLYPFIEMKAAGGPAVDARAGWADEDSNEVESLVVNYRGSPASPAAEKAVAACIEWYVDVLSSLAREQAVEEGAE